MNNDPQTPAAEKEMTVIGVVHPQGSSGFGGSAVIERNLWSLGFSLYAWRTSDDTLHKTDLHIRGEVTHEQLKLLMSQIQALTIVKVRIILKDDFTAQFLELLDFSVDSDQDLLQIADELAKPLTCEHTRFGTFVFDRSIDLWEAKLDWGGEMIHLYIPGAEMSEPDKDLLQTATKLWDNQLSWSQRISDYAVQELLPLKNNTWLDHEAEETPLSADEFKSRMTLETIIVYENGFFEFFYDDGDLFFGHCIHVLSDLENGPSEAEI